jgi:aspartyl/asparaginyl beta-hydroxylase (cupin superfamily)
MKAHSVIPEHIDYMYHYENTIRIHIPIFTNENVIFKFPSVNESLNMKVGDLVEFNNNIPHSGRNDSDQNRIHLIIDYGEKDDLYYGDVEYDWKKYI